MTHTEKLTASALHQFIGTENWYRHALNRKLLYTDGVQYLAEHGGAYWLVDNIALAQLSKAAVRKEAFQMWTLTVKPDCTALLTCGDGNNHIVHAEELPYTDFPLPEIKLYLTDNVLMLTSEY